VARFEFPYMAHKRSTGQKRPPDREPVLRETWLQVVNRLGRERLVIGGKSMGGRIASLVADEAGVAGLVCLGYPFHPTGKPEQLRVAHLRELRTPTLILQGTRDPFGGREEVQAYGLSPAITVHWLEDGNHDLAPRKASGRTTEQNWQEAIATLVAFVNGL
jgi:predicted alpha/beta-hydrolase family hydrolase